VKCIAAGAEGGKFRRIGSIDIPGGGEGANTGEQRGVGGGGGLWARRGRHGEKKNAGKSRGIWNEKKSKRQREVMVVETLASFKKSRLEERGRGEGGQGDPCLTVEDESNGYRILRMIGGQRKICLSTRKKPGGGTTPSWSLPFKIGGDNSRNDLGAPT